VEEKKTESVDLLAAEVLILNSVATGVHTLGPADCIGLWLQGCDLACRGCMSPQTWDPTVGARASVADVAAWMNSTKYRRLSISGGEPFAQAPAVRRLIIELHRARRWTVTIFSGHYLETLQADSPPGSAALLDVVDVLIDGPYESGQHAPLKWRGSRNQTIHDRSGVLDLDNDGSEGMQAVIEPDGSLAFVGVPDRPGFRRGVTEGLADQGVERQTGPQTNFPFPVVRNEAALTQPNNQTKEP